MNRLRYHNVVFYRSDHVPSIGAVPSAFEWRMLTTMDDARSFLDPAFERVHAERFQQGHQCMACLIDGQCAHLGWLATATLRIDELAFMWRIPEGEGCFYDGFTPPAFRGRGVYQATLRWMLSLGSGPKWIYAERANIPSLHAIRKSTFVEMGSIRGVVMGARNILRLGRVKGVNA